MRIVFLENDMSRLVAFGFVTVLLATAPAMAADENVDPKPIAMAMAAAVETDAGIGITSTPLVAPKVSFTERSFERPSAGLSRGAKEANPVMGVATKNPAVFVAVKSAVAAASIYQAERMWRDHHRVRSVVFMAVSNALMAAVAANNHSTLKKLQ